jgi:uncharacterized membrane protein YdjX (TVP38/TMEM64 family)
VSLGLRLGSIGGGAAAKLHARKELALGGRVPHSTSVRQPEPLHPADWLRLALPLLLLATLALIAWKLHYFEQGRLPTAASHARHAWWFGLAFVAVFGAIAALPTPSSPLAYAAGALFGLVQGSLLAWCGSMLGGAAGYWLARGAWADIAARLLGRNEDRLRDVRERKGFLVTLRLRLLPLVPFGVFTYAAGAVRVAFPAYLAGTAIGIIPYTVAAVFAGERVAAGFRGGGRSAHLVAAAVMLALIGVSFLPTVVRKRRER